jgi:hypothetical protein
MKVHQCSGDIGADDSPGCLGCGASLMALGTRDFRFGGMTGGVKLLLGEWAELSEDKLRFEVLACPDCRRVELRLEP